jgi:hypothetical protein
MIMGQMEVETNPRHVAFRVDQRRRCRAGNWQNLSSPVPPRCHEAQRRLWPLARAHERPGQKGCAARDLNPQPAD